MLKISENACKFIIAYGLNPAMTGALSSAFVLCGRSFIVFAKTAALHGGLFGAMQAATAVWLINALPDPEKPVLRLVKNIGCHLISGFVLLVISAIALNAGLIASALTFNAAVILTLANCAFSYGCLQLSDLAVEQMQKVKWVGT